MGTVTLRTLIMADTHMGHDCALPAQNLIGFLDRVKVADHLVWAGDVEEDIFRRHFHLNMRYRQNEVQQLRHYLSNRPDLQAVSQRMPGNHDRWPELWPKDVYGRNCITIDNLPLQLGSKGVLVVHGHERNNLWRLGELRHRWAPWLAPNVAKHATDNAAKRTMRWTGFDRQMAAMAKRMNAWLVVHGHWHTPTVRKRNGVVLVGVPDWQKNHGGAVVERPDGSWAVMNKNLDVLAELPNHPETPMTQHLPERLAA